MFDDARPGTGSAEVDARKKAAVMLGLGDGLQGFELTAENDEVAEVVAAPSQQQQRVVSFHLRDDSAFEDGEDENSDGHLPQHHPTGSKPEVSQRSNRSDAEQTFLSCRASLSDRSLGSNDASFHSTRQHATASVVGSVKSDFTDNDFLSCRDSGDPSTHSKAFTISTDGGGGGASTIGALDDDDSFHSCRKFNEQGLRSVLSESSKRNVYAGTGGDAPPEPVRFNIPLHIVAQGILAAAEQPSKLQKEKPSDAEQPQETQPEQSPLALSSSSPTQRKRPWRSLLMALFIVLVCLAIAGAFLLPDLFRRMRSTSTSNGEKSAASKSTDVSVPNSARDSQSQASDVTAPTAIIASSSTTAPLSSNKNTKSSSPVRAPVTAPSSSPTRVGVSAPVKPPNGNGSSSVTTTQAPAPSSSPLASMVPTAIVVEQSTALPTVSPTNRHYTPRLRPPTSEKESANTALPTVAEDTTFPTSMIYTTSSKGSKGDY